MLQSDHFLALSVETARSLIVPSSASSLCDGRMFHDKLDGYLLVK